MKNLIFILLVVFALSFSLQGCGSDSSSPSGTDPSETSPDIDDDSGVPVTPPPASDTVVSTHSLGTLVDLGDYLNSPDEGWFFASTIDVNSSGQIIGESPGNRLIFWDPSTPTSLSQVNVPISGTYDDYYGQKDTPSDNVFVAFEVLKINDAGLVIGNRYAGVDDSRAFIWNSADGSTIDLAPPNFINDQGDREFGSYSQVLDINVDGAVVLTADSPDGNRWAYYWDGMTYEQINDLTTEGDIAIPAFNVPRLTRIPGILRANNSEAISLNDAGQVVISSLDIGVYYNLNTTGWAALNSLPGAESSTPVAINNNKRIVGTAGNEGFFWDGGVMYPISNPSGAAIEIVDINNNDIVIGNSGGQGFIWHLNEQGKGVYRNIGTLGGSSSTVVGINDRDEIIGYSTTRARYMEGNITADVVHGFLWKDGIRFDLGAHAPPDYEYPFDPEFYSSKAVAISNPGGEEASIVTGISYSINNHARGFTLTPVFPE